MTTLPPDASSQVFEIYKLAVEMADKISARRATANAFYVSLQTAFVGVLSLFGTSLAERSILLNITTCAAGIVLSMAWWLQLKSYRQLNRAKFDVINTVETKLPLQVFTDEWAGLKKDSIPWFRPRYAELGTVERIVPWVFVALYILLFVAVV